MSLTRARVRQLLLLAPLAATLAACGGDATAPATLAGTYTATTFQVTPTGQPTIDVLASGGSLTVSIAPDNTTSGAMTIPPSVSGGPMIVQSMAGTAQRIGSTLRLQPASPFGFMSALTFDIGPRTLSTNQALEKATFAITLRRE